jgi:hypothetical protein
MTDALGKVDRLEAWVDGSAICVIAVSAFGDPLDLGEDEVEEGECMDARTARPIGEVPGYRRILA